ncbi:L-threonylcarbamoyladenylate synthase [Corynebacterium sp. 153RC1]|uniref:L-threonylcarbamoyladenylate synthase n=1 Tax=Corynebacterium TaxID=1716 RepID=UPI00211C9F7F|nr:MULTISPECIES: L-threonylcarbamoyladenylate synthase [unclassified Corynebacterium]MCQ9369911.1 L-threonylcarbamoyladenylate synthase [Corynebacterium sp. 35RC1]MCQ9343565.1 L-threonylcarbamoyladenylate synthase [Corynebacterium sp. 76QC2CO]MCQ9352030.1 L-threonylcarbamoyladenylate synthase [Corynebacterium sp. 209RC1]MCQ9353779.1 L-threonylcarbamoyladenylate synthase [Corynebacterium sp. 1222RC1]MCQ9356237.1 L-threonylcarbamoyladenylate synthase [Corynebacterium sp. 122RC1]
MSRIYDCADAQSREAGISAAVDAVESGRLVVMPTDTLYGLGCNAFDNRAVAKLLETKRRGPDMPVPVLVGSWDTARGLVHTFDTQLRTLIEAFWPGGLSLVVPQAPSLPWNLGDTRGTVMLRMPLHPVAIELLRRTGPMAVSSANISGQTPPATVHAAKEQLGESVAIYLDGGECALGLASTIVDLSGQTPRILREGAISAERIAEVLELDVEALR